jgi:hypothetical protein
MFTFRHLVAVPMILGACAFVATSTDATPAAEAAAAGTRDSEALCNGLLDVHIDKISDVIDVAILNYAEFGNIDVEDIEVGDIIVKDNLNILNVNAKLLLGKLFLFSNILNDGKFFFYDVIDVNPVLKQHLVDNNIIVLDIFGKINPVLSKLVILDLSNPDVVKVFHL